MFGRVAQSRLAPFVTLYLWTWRTAAYVQIPFSSTYYGVDGPWQAVSVNVGGWIDDTVESYQWTGVDLLPGGYYSCFALDSKLCSQGSSLDCGEGGTWKPVGAQDGIDHPIFWEPSLDYTTTSGLYMMGPIYAQNLNVNGNTMYTVPNASIAVATVGNQTLPDGNRIDLENGFFSLGADDQQQVFTTGGTSLNDSSINAWIMPGYFYNKSITDSYSYTLHLGSTAFDYAGSMYFGGYDKGRALGPGTTYDDNLQLLDITLGVETGGSPFKFGNMSGLLLTNTSANEQVQVTPEPILPYLHLSKQTCDKLASKLPVTFDSSGYYLWDTTDPAYTNITTSAAYLGFVFPPATGGTKDVTIKVPFQLLVLNLTQEASGKSGLTPYFPCMPYESEDGNYFLGRAFLQAAFWGRNWNRKVSWLAQAPGPGTSKTGLGFEPTDIKDSATTLEFFPDDGRFVDSWSDYWTPLPGDDGVVSPSGSSGSNGGGGSDETLSTGAKAGIGVGAAAVGVGLLGIAAFFLARRRKHSKDTGSEQRPFAAAHYGDDAKASAPAAAPFRDDPQQQQDSYYQPHGMGDQAYAGYKPQPQPHHAGGDDIQLSELSGTMRNPAQELPAHEPSELPAPYKQPS